ncbi:MAG: 2-keto-4-pentenoate hydratase [SAR324 cluster bacterium]
MADVRQATEAIWAATMRREYFPAAWKGRLTVDEGYGVQLGLLDRYTAGGERHVGWKVGLTARAIREQVGMFEPVLGFLLASGHWATGREIPFDSLLAPSIENELCLTVGRTLQGPGVTEAQARAALSAAAPAFEVVERRGDFVADLPLALADNCQQKGFVTGTAQLLAPGVRLAATTVEVRVNGAPVERATGAEVMGDPAASVAWLANKLAQFGRSLETGMLVMSGSFTRQVAPSRGDRIEARFSPFGTVAVHFT